METYATELDDTDDSLLRVDVSVASDNYGDEGADLILFGGHFG